MRQIGSLENQSDADRFGAFLLTLGVKNTVDEGPDGSWSVWVEDDDHLDRGRAELNAFRASPADPRYDAAVGRAEQVRKAEAKAEQRRREKFVDVRTRWGQPGQLARPLTIILVVCSILVGIGTRLGDEHGPITNAVLFEPVRFVDDKGWLDSNRIDAIRSGQVWRLVTPIFMHFGVLHLVFNMFWLVDLGSQIETRRSTWFLLLLVLVTAVLSNTAEYYLPNPADPHAMSGGMSGINYALFGYVWIKGRVQPHLGMGVNQETVIVMLAWFVICAVGIIPNVGNFAHGVGLLSGVAFAYLPYAFKRLRRGR